MATPEEINQLEEYAQGWLDGIKERRDRAKDDYDSKVSNLNIHSETSLDALNFAYREYAKYQAELVSASRISTAMLEQLKRNK